MPSPTPTAARSASSWPPGKSATTPAPRLCSTICPTRNGYWGDRGYDADWFRKALQAKGIKPYIPGRKSRLQPVQYDKRRYKRRNRIEIMFGRLKDWRCVAKRCDRCPSVFFSAIALAATVIFWLRSTSPDPSPAYSSKHRQRPTPGGPKSALRSGILAALRKY